MRARSGRRNRRTVSVLRQRRAEAHGRPLPRKRGRMTLRSALGLDIRPERYAYGHDERAGYTAARRVADRWVQTTCGYCSVGCGMFIGVKDGRAVGVEGDPDHPVNAGALCPKGLAEHETIHADTRARYPLLRRDRGFERVSWPDAIETMARRFRGIQD